MMPSPKFEVDPIAVKAAFLDYNQSTLHDLALNNVVLNFSEFHVTAHFQILFQLQDIIAIFNQNIPAPLSHPLRATYSTRRYGQPDILRVEWRGQIAEIPESDEFWDALTRLLSKIVLLDNNRKSHH